MLASEEVLDIGPLGGKLLQQGVAAAVVLCWPLLPDNEHAASVRQCFGGWDDAQTWLCFHSVHFSWKVAQRGESEVAL
jgi:hypothetical protein